VALHLDPSGPEPVRDTRKVRVGEIGEERGVVRDGVQHLAHGALVCPACNLPLALPGAVHAGTELRCGYCDHVARAREFVAADVYDTVANEVYVIATLA
jgi:hypothetical protein